MAPTAFREFTAGPPGRRRPTLVPVSVRQAIRRSRHTDRVYRVLVGVAPLSPARLPMLKLVAHERCKEGRFAEAAWAFDRAVEIAPEDSLLGTHWALARFPGRVDDACRWYGDGRVFR